MSTAPDSSSNDHDERLAEVLSVMTDQIAQGIPVDIDQVCRENPDLSRDLRSLWGAVLVADVAGVAGPANDAATLNSGTDSSTSVAEFSLPCVIGDYELQEEIGRGGMGVVYLGRQTNLDREVAVKMISPSRLASEEDIARFNSEATAAAQLEHPGIVPVYEVGQLDGRAFFSMQYIQGPTLAELIAKGPIDQRQAARIVAMVARAVQHAHTSGVLHRDLKPSNILLDSENRPLVTDFGLAKQIAEDTGVTRTGAVLGTPKYMSPEQAAGRRNQMGPTTDVYSLGCVLYHALCGRPPLVADSAVELVLMILEQEPLPPRSLRPNIDHDLEMIVIRCLQKPHDLRYPSAGELADDLESFLSSEPIAARSGRIGQVMARALRETHHAAVLENWGLLWMWHSLVLFVACSLTWGLHASGITNRMAYGALWTVGLGAWAAVFWFLRRRMGPVTFVERQIAHVWGASMLGIGFLFPLEYHLSLPVLSLSPLLGVISAMVFFIKAAILSGAFYVQAVVLLVTAWLMMMFPDFGHLIFGGVAAATFFFPGLKYFRQKQRNLVAAK